MRLAAAILCLFPASSCKTLENPDPCDPSHLEEVSEPLAEEGDFKGLYEMYLPCAEQGTPGAELTIAILIASDTESEILELDETQRQAEALKWICRSALHGHEEAIETVADSYRFGWFELPKDPEREACWRSKLEDGGAPTDCECL